MTSRQSESRQSMGPPQLGRTPNERRREPNPNTNYKAHFNRTKEKFDLVTADQKARKKELDRATLKQAKLQEELEYLLDAIAGEQLRARQSRQSIEEKDMATEEVYQPNNFYPPRDGSNEDMSVLEGQQQQQQLHHYHHHHRERARPAASKRQRPSPTDTEDELLEIAGEPTKRVREEL